MKGSVFRPTNFSRHRQGLNPGPLAQEASVLTTRLLASRYLATFWYKVYRLRSSPLTFNCCSLYFQGYYSISSFMRSWVQSPQTYWLNPGRPMSSKTHKQSLKVLNINCQSIVNKKAEFQIIIDNHKPDIVVGTESWLNKTHLSSEVFPNSLGYTPFRQDRETDTCGV